MSRKDPYSDAFKAAANATLARFRRDRAKAPAALSQLFSVVGRRLFDPTLDATLAWKVAGLKDRSMGSVFKDATQTTLARYIAGGRIEVAHVLRITTDLSLASIAERVGFNSYRAFLDTYQRLKKKSPSEKRQRLPPPLLDDETGLLAVRGLLDEEGLVRFMRDLLKVYSSKARRVREEIGAAAPEPLIIVDGAGTDRLRAEALWREIRDLPFDEQCRRVRGYRFCSTVFFDLLREKSLVAGRKNRRRGVELAELMLLSLENSDAAFGERIHDLRALAWAWIGNAYRLALDFLAASGAFEQAEREWSKPRAKPDLSVLAHIFRRKGALRMVRREYAAATEDLDRSCSLFRQLDRPRDEALGLIQRAAVQIYADKLDNAVDDLREAARLIDEEEEKELALAIRGNLANALARAGNAKSAAEELHRARLLNQAIDDPLGAIKLDWIDGLISELRDDLQAAKRFYLASLAGFREAGEQRYFGITSVDLMVVYAKQDDWGNVMSLVAEAVPILGSQQLHDETLSAIRLLTKAVETRDISRRLLTELQAALRQDPLAM